MARLDKTIPKSAKKLVDALGISATFTLSGAAEGAGSYDPRTGRNYSTATSATHVAKVTPIYGRTKRPSSGGEIQEDFSRIFLPAKDLGWSPTTRTKVAIAGESFRVQKIGPISSGDELAGWELDLVKWSESIESAA